MFVSFYYAERHFRASATPRHVSLRTPWKYLEVVLSIITKSEELQFTLILDHIVCKRISTFLFRTSPEFEITCTCLREALSSSFLLSFYGDLIG